MHCFVYFEALKYFYNNTSICPGLKKKSKFNNIFYITYLYVLFAILGL